MKELVPLVELNLNEQATIKECCINSGIARRLLDLGCIENTPIEKIYRSPSNNPCAYMLRGAIIAIRNEIAIQILVEREAIV